MRNFIFSLFVFSSLLGLAQKATITGTVTDKDMNNETLPFANVLAKGTKSGTTTDEKGNYTLNVEPGNLNIEFSFLGYETVVVPVVIKAGQTLKLNQVLGSGEGVSLQDVVIVTTTNKETEGALLQDQIKAVEIKQSIGSQEMSRKGVSNVEQGVTKISGISKVIDRGIFIRGLDDRYNYMQVNGLNFVPSDPLLKTLPLNFIPTNIVRNLDIFKTYNTDLYSDFAGGSINIITKDVTSKPTTIISINTGMNTNTTFKNFRSSDSGNLEFFGYDNGFRNLPSIFDYNKPLQYQATSAESKDLFNASWTPTDSKAPLALGTGVFHSQSFSLENDKKWGYLFNINFENDYLYQNGLRRNLNSEGTATKDFQRTKYNYKTQKSVLGTFNYKKINAYNFDLHLIYMHNSSNIIDEVRGDNIDFITTNRPFFLRDTKYEENFVAAVQHLGQFFFKDKKDVLEYGISFSTGSNNLPDRRVLIAEGEGSDAEYITFNGADPFRYFSQLENNNINGKVNYSVQWKKTESGFANKLKFGFASDMTTYNFNQKFIRIFGGSTLSNNIYDTNNPQPFFDNAFNEGTLSYRSNPDPTYEIEINQFVNAGFVNYTKTLNKLVIDLGLRLEYFFREINYREETFFVTDSKSKIKLDDLAVNPVLNLKYSLNDKQNIRFTASRTSTKPRMREVLPYRYFDGDGNTVLGNASIVNTDNYNLDLKYEWFAKKDLYISTALFGKYIKNPISRILTSASTGYFETYENFDEASLFGLELEINTSLNHIFGESTFAKNFSIGANTIIMQSNEKADKNNPKFGGLTSVDRSLQGASDFIINADLAYTFSNTEKFESKLNIVFNTFTERIYAVGFEGAGDIKEQPINMLDLTWRNMINKKFGFNFNVRNILNEDNLRLQTATKTIANPDKYSPINHQLPLGTNFSLEFTYKF